MKVGLKYKALKEFYYINYTIRIGDIVEIFKLDATNLIKKYQSDLIVIVVKSGLTLNISRFAIENEDNFKPYFRDRNLDELIS